MSDIFTDEEAARHLGICSRTLRGLIKAGDAPPFFIVGKRRRFRRDALDTYARRREGVRPTVPAPEAPNSTAGAPQGRHMPADPTETMHNAGVHALRCRGSIPFDHDAVDAIWRAMYAAADVPAPEAPNSTAGAPQGRLMPAAHQPSPLDGAPRLNAVERTLIESCHAALRLNLTLTRSRCLELLRIIDKLAPVWRAPPPPPAEGHPALAATDSNS